MTKIMFSDKFGLTQAVLEGRKTMTRRIVPKRVFEKVEEYQREYYEKTLQTISAEDAILNMVGAERMFKCAYKVGETVAMAQSGKNIYHALQARYGMTSDAALGFKEMYEDMAMWNNKMFTPADLCPYHIRITGIKVERLQDISDEDCLKEGVCFDSTHWIMGYKVENLWNKIDRQSHFRSARVAFAGLIDKVSGKGTWEKNPYVFAYTFELID